MQEKYGEGFTATKTAESSENDSSSESEEEDDDGILASGLLDEQINATLQAIRSKDPKVYDEKTTFYTVPSDGEDEISSNVVKKEIKPMYLRDYHRQQLLQGNAGLGDEDKSWIFTYAEEQDRLKDKLVKEMHKAVEIHDSDVSDQANNKDNFLVKKQLPVDDSAEAQLKLGIAAVDVENADKDPETFLSNFISARSWVPSAGVKYQPFESDDEEEDQRAEAFEDAYNLRFEDPKGSNEKLMSYARDNAGKYSVRKDTGNIRKRARDAERTSKENAKLEHERDKARFRKLKIEEAEEKLKKIKDAAGLSGTKVNLEDWSSFIYEDWDDKRWETEMNQKFGEDYYDQDEVYDDDRGAGLKKKKIKKPKWDDDIDITDLIPDYAVEGDMKLHFSLSDDSGNENGSTKDNEQVTPAARDRKNRKKIRAEQKNEARKERQRLEQMIDQKLNTDVYLHDKVMRSSTAGRFQYRETTPVAFGLTPQDILMASDSQLNQYAGLKKMAAFRDTEKKKKDKKHLGKKARLRLWRKETFGSEQGPQETLQELIAQELLPYANDLDGDKPVSESIGLTPEAVKKRRRSKKGESKGTKLGM